MTFDPRSSSPIRNRPGRPSSRSAPDRPHRPCARSARGPAHPDPQRAAEQVSRTGYASGTLVKIRPPLKNQSETESDSEHEQVEVANGSQTPEVGEPEEEHRTEAEPDREAVEPLAAEYASLRRAPSTTRPGPVQLVDETGEIVDRRSSDLARPGPTRPSPSSPISLVVVASVAECCRPGSGDQAATSSSARNDRRARSSVSRGGGSGVAACATRRSPSRTMTTASRRCASHGLSGCWRNDQSLLPMKFTGGDEDDRDRRAATDRGRADESLEHEEVRRERAPGDDEEAQALVVEVAALAANVQSRFQR